MKIHQLYEAVELNQDEIDQIISNVLDRIEVLQLSEILDTIFSDEENEDGEEIDFFEMGYNELYRWTETEGFKNFVKEEWIQTAIDAVPDADEFFIYRMIGVDINFKIENLKRNPVGIYWSHSMFHGPYQYWKGSGTTDNLFLIEATIHRNSIDWVETITANAIPQTSGEQEINVVSEAPLLVTRIFQVHSDSQHYTEDDLELIYDQPFKAKA